MMDDQGSSRIERLAAIGELVNGFAHELNNVLAAVLGYAELLSMEDLPPRIQEDIGKIRLSGQRARRILTGLLTFARPHPAEIQEVHPAELLDSVAELLAYECRVHRVEILKDYGQDLPPFRTDIHRLRMILLMLAHSACGQISGAQPAGGTLRLRSRAWDGSLMIEIGDGGVEGGDLVPAREADRPKAAPGSPSDAVSTKLTGMGPGVARAILEELGGRIEPVEDPGARVCSRLVIPLSYEPNAGEERGPATRVAGRATGPAGVARILVVDDEDLVRDILARILVQAGCRCDAVPTGKEALHLLDQEEFDAVILDWHMPDMSGREIFEAIEKRHPGLEGRVLIVTGDTGEGVVEFAEKRRASLIEKPFAMGTVRAAVEKVLAEPARG